MDHKKALQIISGLIACNMVHVLLTFHCFSFSLHFVRACFCSWWFIATPGFARGLQGVFTGKCLGASRGPEVGSGDPVRLEVREVDLEVLEVGLEVMAVGLEVLEVYLESWRWIWKSWRWIWKSWRWKSWWWI